MLHTVNSIVTVIILNANLCILHCAMKTLINTEYVSFF